MKIKVHFFDSFTTQRFAGNSAAVIFSENWLADSLMQNIATENNLSETAFLVKTAPQHYHIRWFSPLTEIDFCGHAALAAAFQFFSDFPEQNEVIFYAEAVGNMTLSRAANQMVKMDFPNRKPKTVENVPQALLDGLSIAPNRVLRNEQAYFAIYDTPQAVLKVRQNSQPLKTLAPYDVVVSAASESADSHDFISRYFWPANGGEEDPVTGSIHTGLAPYWAEQLGKTHLVAYQASKRGGWLVCDVQDDATSSANHRVLISGNAVPYLEGWIHLDD